jgi:hypothetical protein
MTDADRKKIVDGVIQGLRPILETLPLSTERWVDAETLARILGVGRDFIYNNKDQLGVRRLGTGPKARLRFNPEKAKAALHGVANEASDAALRKKPTHRRPRHRKATVKLLPIYGRSESDTDL